jgi:mutator protein MutT
MIEKHYPSNEWKYCHYCGSQEIDWNNGTSRMFCRHCCRSFFINAAAAVIALIKNEKGDFLFTRRKNNPEAGKLDFPGGFANIGESAENAVKREIREELGLKLTEIKYYTSIPNRYLYDGIVYFTMDLVFLCKYNSLEGIAAADDISEFAFIDVKNVDIDDVGLESVKKIVEQLKINN